MKTLVTLLLATILCYQSIAQEIQAKVTVNAVNMASTVNRKLFTTLQASLVNFINNRKWTDKNYATNEKITCNFTISILKNPEPDVYVGTIAVQAARPVYNSSYTSPLINFVDEKFAFKYLEFQAIDYNDNRIQGSDALVANLPATLAYYINIIVGLDANTFALRSGEPYFVKALNIVTNAPANATIEGWKAFDGQRNRYWLAENLTSTKFTAVHEVMYNYYRKAFDFLYENENQARQEMIACLTQLNNTRNENSGTTNMLIPFLMQAKNNELIQFFKKANATDKATALELLKQIDVINANKYTSELK